jgi:hypothetical protein
MGPRITTYNKSHISLTVILPAIVALESACGLIGPRLTQPTSPATDLHAVVESADLILVLNHVIHPNGPGAWLKDAKWQEYALTLQNRSNHPIKIEQIQLLDANGNMVEPQTSLTQLEKQSELLLQRFVRQYGTQALRVGYQSVSQSQYLQALRAVPYLSSVLDMGTAGATSLLDMYKQRQREQIIEEMARRRLTTLSIGPSSSVAGSQFFPIVPNAQKLHIRYESAAGANVLELPLDRVAQNPGEAGHSVQIGLTQ